MVPSAYLELVVVLTPCSQGAVFFPFFEPFPIAKGDNGTCRLFRVTRLPRGILWNKTNLQCNVRSRFRDCLQYTIEILGTVWWEAGSSKSYLGGREWNEEKRNGLRRRILETFGAVRIHGGIKIRFRKRPNILSFQVEICGGSTKPDKNLIRWRAI